jgi:hypothetical protein
MKKARGVLILVTLMASGSCSHKAVRGTVTLKASENEAHVSMSHGHVKLGDRVILFRNFCHEVDEGEMVGVTEELCENDNIGLGTVEKVLNSHDSTVKFDSGVQFEQGMFVEKR